MSKQTITLQHPSVQVIFQALKCYKIEHNGNSPTVRKLGYLVGIPHPSMVHRYLEPLEDAGLIKRTPAGIDLVGYEYRKVTS